MISILIPTYNYSCYDLVHALQRQAELIAREEDTFVYEILVADDASTKQDLQAENGQIAMLPHCRYLPLAENMGRSRIRNYLADEARYDYLLFIDSDAVVADGDYLRRYLEAVRLHGVEVVCGGVANIPALDDPACSLRFYYEEAVGKGRLASERRKHPCAHFSTFNFLIRRELFQSVRFDERCRHYGYEDVLFGMELERRGVSILHIDNALIHAGVERNEVFLAKTETALRTLHEQDGALRQYVTLSRVALRLKKLHLLPLLAWWHALMGPLVRRQLLERRPSIFLFHLYKLGYYAALEGESRNGSASQTS